MEGDTRPDRLPESISSFGLVAQAPMTRETPGPRGGRSNRAAKWLERGRRRDAQWIRSRVESACFWRAMMIWI